MVGQPMLLLCGAPHFACRCEAGRCADTEKLSSNAPEFALKLVYIP